MRLRTAFFCCLTFGLLPLNLSALSLGEISLRSNLNEPFNAEITLDAAPNEDLSSLEVSLADTATFSRYGLDRPQFLTNLDFTITTNEAGLSIIRLTSLVPISEPFVTLLLDIDWASGRLLREYTVLLDPPLYEEAIVQTPAIAAPVAEPSGEMPAEGSVDRLIEIPPVESTAESFATEAEPVAETFGESVGETSAEPLADAFQGEPEVDTPLNIELPTESIAETPTGIADPVPAEELAPFETQADASSTLAPQGPTTGVQPGNYEVQTGDTLWEVADNARGGSGLTINQMMLALYRANPQAFVGNINGLKAGAILRIPGEEEIAVISRTEATAEVRDQNSAWQANNVFEESASESTTVADADGPKLELIAPGTDVSEGAGLGSDAETATDSATTSSSAAETAGLKLQLADLEAQLGDNERLLEVRDAELSALQARIQELEAQIAAQESSSSASTLESEVADVTSALESEAGVTEIVPDEQTLSALEQEAELGTDADLDVALDAEIEAELQAQLDTELGAEEVDAGADATEGTESSVETIEEAAQEAQTSASNETATSDAPAAEPSLVDRLLSNVWLLGGIVGAVLVVFLLARRRRQALEAEPFDTGEWQPPVMDPAEVGSGDAAAEQNFVVEESEPLATAQFEAVKSSGKLPVTEVAQPEAEVIADAPIEEVIKPEPQVAADDGDDEVPLERTISTGAPINLDQADPIAEAEFHMAYGLYDQAADLLTQALAKEPDNRAYRVKLIEVFFVWENRDGFLEHARQLHKSLDADSENDWNKVLILGKQLCPDDVLFAGAQTAAPAADSMDLELPEASGESETSLDFSLDSPTVEVGLAGQADADIDFNIGDADLAPANAPDMDISLDMDDAGGESMDIDFGAEHETDMSNSFLALDVGEFEGDQGDGEDTVESPTIDALGSDAPTVESPALADSNAITMESPALEGFDSTADTMESPTLESISVEDGSETTEMPGLDIDDIDSLDLTGDGGSEDSVTLMISDPDSFPELGGASSDSNFADTGNELSDTEELAELIPDDSGIDLGSDLVGSDTAEQPALSNAAEADTALADPEAAAEIPQEATMTEVGTKLDLARAYIDMGDPDGARSILNEVLAEGSDAQKQEASQLLGELDD